MKYKIILSYDGTDFGGWQIQPNAVTIQELVQNALKTIFRTPCEVTASGRTDAGVHARWQVAHTILPRPIDCSALRYSLNGILPKTIRILEVSSAPDEFHARYSSKRKIYHYHLTLAPVQNPFTFRYSTHLTFPLDLSLIQEALPSLIGTHDFTSFAGSGCGSKDPVKTLYRLDLIPEEGGTRFEFEGSGFLYKMVRNIMGTLIEIGSHKRLASDLPFILKGKDRRLAGPTAPPQGLILYDVKY